MDTTDRRLQVGDRRLDVLHLHSYLYRDVMVQIRQQITSVNVPWTYYLFLHLDFFADEELRRTLWVRAKTVQDYTWWEYTRCAFLRNLPWHGGLTYYKKHTQPDGSRSIQVGCDYGHLWDRDRTYTLRDVIADAEATVDALHEAAVYKEQEDSDVQAT